MHAAQIAEEFPVVDLDAHALDAARLLARRRLPGLLVADDRGRPLSVLPAAEVVRFLVPRYVQDTPALAGVLDESSADRVAEKLRGVTVRSLLPERQTELPVVRGDDTILEVASVMTGTHSPLVAVLQDDTLIGVITASRLLELALAPERS